jgi:hypothetical protein
VRVTEAVDPDRDIADYNRRCSRRSSPLPRPREPERIEAEPIPKGAIRKDLFQNGTYVIVAVACFVCSEAAAALAIRR